jgi:hypothetical protein
MQFDSSHNAVPSSSLKRPFALQAAGNPTYNPTPGEYPTQAKFPKVEEPLLSREGILSKDAQPSYRLARMSQSRTAKTTSLRAPRSATTTRPQSKGKSKLEPSSTSSHAATLDLPARDHNFILHEHQSKSQHLPSIKPVYEDNPKSPLSNFFSNVIGRPPEYHSVLGVYPDRSEKIWRSVSSCRIAHFLTSFQDNCDSGNRIDCCWYRRQCEQEGVGKTCRSLCYISAARGSPGMNAMLGLLLSLS